MKQELIRQEALKLIRAQNREKARRYREKLKSKGKAAATFILSEDVRAFLKAESERTGETTAVIVERAIRGLMGISAVASATDKTHREIELTDADRMLIEVFESMALEREQPSWTEIAARLNDAGMRTLKGKKWKADNVRWRFLKLKKKGGLR